MCMQLVNAFYLITIARLDRRMGEGAEPTTSIARSIHPSVPAAIRNNNHGRRGDEQIPQQSPHHCSRPILTVCCRPSFQLSSRDSGSSRRVARRIEAQLAADADGRSRPDGRNNVLLCMKEEKKRGLESEEKRGRLKAPRERDSRLDCESPFLFSRVLFYRSCVRPEIKYLLRCYGSVPFACAVRSGLCANRLTDGLLV